MARPKVAKKKPRRRKTVAVARREAEQALRKRFVQLGYPTIAIALDELRGSGLHSRNGSFLDAVIEAARAEVMRLIGDRSVFVPETLAHLERIRMRELSEA